MCRSYVRNLFQNSYLPKPLDLYVLSGKFWNLNLNTHRPLWSLCFSELAEWLVSLPAINANTLNPYFLVSVPVTRNSNQVSVIFCAPCFNSLIIYWPTFPGFLPLCKQIVKTFCYKSHFLLVRLHLPCWSILRSFFSYDFTRNKRWLL